MKSGGIRPSWCGVEDYGTYAVFSGISFASLRFTRHQTVADVSSHLCSTNLDTGCVAASCIKLLNPKMPCRNRLHCEDEMGKVHRHVVTRDD
jgi:hypothetical protein